MKSFLLCFICVWIATTNSQTIQSSSAFQKINYPIRFSYVNRIDDWWFPQKMAAGLGVPGFAVKSQYNYIALAFWSCSTGPLDIVKIWNDPIKYFRGTFFGATKSQAQSNLKKKYNDGGVKILISAFGGTQFPTTQGQDPVVCANKLGQFVLQNNLDGVDIDYQDNQAMQAGLGQQWLISFQSKLRQLLPSHIITHTPQAPYFKQQYYRKGGYVTVNNAVGNMIDFYNIQFYNQGDTTYDSYQKLFLNSGGYFSGTSVMEIANRGVPLRKIIVGKPITPADAANTGFMNRITLGNSVSRAYKQLGWFSGLMNWQYPSDQNGKKLKTTYGRLLTYCLANKNCI